MKLARLPRVMWMLGLIQDPDDAKAARDRTSTFARRYRSNPDFPKPVQSPEGRLIWREDEIDRFIANLPRAEGDPRADVWSVRPGHKPDLPPREAA